METILIIEDERDMAELIAFNLEREGFLTLQAHDGNDGLRLARTGSPALILLDLMLPGIMGTELCRQLRSTPETATIPVIMLTARGEEIDRVVGFEVGADDYLVKPFSMRELVLRIRAVLRRRALSEAAGGTIIRIGGLELDTERCTAAAGGVELTLTTTEYRLLLYLAERTGRVQSRELLLQNVWGYNYLGDTRTVDTHMTRLRGKLGGAGEQIKTIRGFGYKLEDR